MLNMIKYWISLTCPGNFLYSPASVLNMVNYPDLSPDRLFHPPKKKGKNIPGLSSIVSCIQLLNLVKYLQFIQDCLLCSKYGKIWSEFSWIFFCIHLLNMVK